MAGNSVDLVKLADSADWQARIRFLAIKYGANTVMTEAGTVTNHTERVNLFLNVLRKGISDDQLATLVLIIAAVANLVLVDPTQRGNNVDDATLLAAIGQIWTPFAVANP